MSGISVAEILELENSHDENGQRALEALESGGVVYLANAQFEMSSREHQIIADTQVTLPTRKERESRNGRPTIMFEPERGRILRSRIKQPERAALETTLSRYADWASETVNQLFPGYAPNLKRDRTTYRPCERASMQGMHVDSSYGRPTGGHGMLRVFCNINPFGEPRIWRIGETFETLAGRFAPNVKVKPVGIGENILSSLNIIKGRRTKYDHVMEDIRGQVKSDNQYQREAPQKTVEFPAGSTWIAITDLVLHGAVSGQHAMDQTFFLPPQSMQHPERSSLKILERLTSQVLT